MESAIHPVKKLYDAVKLWYLDAYDKSGFFYIDYFKDQEEGFKNFVDALKQYEPQLDISREATDNEIETVIDHIKEGIQNSNSITVMVDGITDKYFSKGDKY